MSASSTGSYTGGYAYIDYLGGQTIGPAVQDVFAIGSAAWNQTFIAAASSSWGNIPADGFLGMAFAVIADGDTNTVVETLLAQDALDEPKFGIYYGTELRNTGGVPGIGAITLGSSREEELVEGELVTVPLQQSNGEYQVWRTDFKAVTGSRTIGDEVVETTTNLDLAWAVFDTGGGRITLPKSKTLPIYESLGWNFTQLLNGERILDCSEFNSSWSVSFTLGSSADPKIITMTGDELAVPGFANRESACWPPFDQGDVEGFALFGTALLKHFYTIWDYGTKGTVKNSEYKPTVSFGTLKPEFRPVPRQVA